MDKVSKFCLQMDVIYSILNLIKTMFKNLIVLFCLSLSLSLFLYILGFPIPKTIYNPGISGYFVLYPGIPGSIPGSCTGESWIIQGRRVKKQKNSLLVYLVEKIAPLSLIYKNKNIIIIYNFINICN